MVSSTRQISYGDKESPERFRSYLMVHDLGEGNVDEIIRIARGGFGCIEFYPWRSTPSYEINPALFPNGLEGLQTVITRGSPHYDPIHYGRREYTLRFKGINPAGHARNLLSGDVGWFAPHAHSLTADAVTPDEVLLLCLKALGGKAPISFSVSAANLWRNERMPEIAQLSAAVDISGHRRLGLWVKANGSGGILNVGCGPV